MDFLNVLPEKEKEKILQAAKPCLNLDFKVEDDLPLTASRLAGYGYLPKSMPYPRSREDGMPLILLAQINFAEMPKLEDFPEKGILAFYINGQAEVYGLNFEDQTNDADFRVLYFPDESQEAYSAEEQAAIFAESDFDEEYSFSPVYPLDKPVRMIAEPGQSLLLTDCKESEQLFGGSLYPYYSQLLGQDSPQYKAVEEIINRHHPNLISGYPYFTQYDPRLDSDPENEFDTLLFQLDTSGGEGWSIMWGDAGVGNFFINRERLKNLDFNRVLYNWDCC